MLSKLEAHLAFLLLAPLWACSGPGTDTTPDGGTGGSVPPAVDGPASVFIATDGDDGNPCTEASPCKTFARGYDVAAAGAIVEVAGGSYPAQELDALSAKADNAFIIIRPAASATVTLTGGVGVNQTNNVEIRGMATTGWAATASDRVVFRDLVARNINVASLGTVGYLQDTTNVYIIGGEIGWVDPADGIQIWPGTAPNKNVTIQGLYMHDFTRALDAEAHDDCIQAASVDGLTVRNSRFVNCGTQVMFLNPFANGVVKHVLVENNMFGGAQLGYNTVIVGEADDVQIRFNSFTQSPRADATASTNVHVVGNRIAGYGYTGGGYNCGVLADTSVEFAYNLVNADCDGADASNTMIGNLDSDFANASESDSSMFDLHLKPGVSATGTVTTGCPETDYDGDARASGGPCTAGADEP